MHVVHLALAPDAICSALMDWSDDQTYFLGTSRDKRLDAMFENYRQWCETCGYPVSDRCQRRLFTTNILKPEGGKYVEVSQKTLSATAARYMVFWLNSVAQQFAENTTLDSDMYLDQF